MTSAVFDVVFKDVTAARRLVAVGLAATPPTVLAGWADYALLNRRQRRVGLVHAASNALGVTMFALSYRAYRRHRNRAARTYTFLGLAAISVGGALGGHLSYAQGAGMFRWQPLRAVTQPQPDRIPTRRMMPVVTLRHHKPQVRLQLFCIYACATDCPPRR